MVVGGDVVDFDGGDSELGQVVVEVEVGGHGFDVGGEKKFTQREVRETAFVGVYIDRVRG